MTTATVQVQKLEALLARVQRNRAMPQRQPQQPQHDEVSFADVPSLVPEPQSVAAAPPPRAPAPATVPRPAMRAVTEPVAPPSSASRSPRTPLEIAVEDKLDRPSVQPHVSTPQAVPSPLSFAQSTPQEPVMLADPAPPVASRAIGQVVSKAPPITALSFGDILRRSLSLRPR